jgi:hypothetical protein
MPVGERFSAPVQTGPVAHPASFKMDTGSFPGVENGWDWTLTPHPLLVSRSKIQSRAIPVPSLRAFVAYEKGETYLQLLNITFADNLYSNTVQRKRYVVAQKFK